MTTGAGFPDAHAGVEPLLAVADLGRSLAFWQDGMGGEPLVSWDSYVLLRLGEGRLHLAVTGDPPEDRGIRLVPPGECHSEATGEVVLHVSDCATVVGKLEQRGIRFLGPPTSPPWGGDVRAFLRDPDGHLIEISSVTHAADVAGPPDDS